MFLNFERNIFKAWKTALYDSSKRYTISKNKNFNEIWFKSSFSTVAVAKNENKLFSKVLVANRGEIACRVIQTCKNLNIRTVAVYSDADSNAQHVKLADEAYYLGGNAPQESYLNMDKILSICSENGVQAVHPGYGFLSENADFSAACKSRGIEFIGPPESAIISMGSKSESKRIMLAADVPCTPGYHGEDQAVERLKKEAKYMGYPVMLKAVMGGGGKGMRIVRNESEIQENIDSCKREALSSFGDDRILIEKYLVGTRHIEFQVFADKFGNCVHFFERDCSVQRRHQKVLEEAPAPFLPEGLRKKMGDAAVNAAKAVNYVGAGTVEFMLDCNDEEVTENSPFYFMEMNTRLQVEHPVTEMITGVDLVELQLKIASGQELLHKQEELFINGHAIEARIYAENPSAGFLPGSGKLTHLSLPKGEGIRVDTGVIENDSVSVFYDPMISKLIVHGKDREEALKYMQQALKEYNIGGLSTNISFVTKCLNTEDFIKGGVTTKFIENNENELLFANETEQKTLFIKAAAFSYAMSCIKDNKPLFGYRNIGNCCFFKCFEVQSNDFKDILEVELEIRVKQDKKDKSKLKFNIKEKEKESKDILNFTISKKDEGIYINNEGKLTNLVIKGTDEVNYIFKGIDEKSDKNNVVYRIKRVIKENISSVVSNSNIIKSPMPGKIVKVECKEGELVDVNDIVIVMEAMKMEHTLKTTVKGVVKDLIVSVGDVVDDNVILCKINPIDN